MRKYVFVCAAMVLLASFMSMMRAAPQARAQGQYMMNTAPAPGNRGMAMPEGAPPGPVHGPPPPANAAPAVGLFYDALLPYGEWVWTASCGWVWSPYDTPIDWRPYSHGHWVNTEDYGYTWESDEPWAWACYHYGRWFHDADYGWVWCPTDTWGPAWVAWDYNAVYVGWGPLPPRVPAEPGIGLDLAGVDLFSACPPFAFSFCDLGDFLSPDLNDFLFPVVRNEFCLHDSHIECDLRFDRDHHRFFNHFPREDSLRERLGHDIPKFKTREVNSVADLHTGNKAADEMLVFRADRKAVAEGRTRYKPAMTETGTPRNEVTLPRSEQDIMNRQTQERLALQERHQSWQNWLGEQHKAEIANPPAELAPERLQMRQQFEQQSLQNHIQREQHILDTWHQREAWSRPPSMGISHRFDFGGETIHNFGGGSQLPPEAGSRDGGPGRRR